MKILMIDKYYFIKGGAERYAFELSRILEANGHTVVPFAMQHPDNFQTRYARYFVSNIEYNVSSLRQKMALGLKATARMIYSFEAKRKLEALIRDVEPDIAHLHMIEHQLSPSILHTLKKYNIPTIQTVHQYKLVCPNYRLYNPRTRSICLKCVGSHAWHPVFERCHKNSLMASLIISIESAIHRKTKIYERGIDLFHVPSKFMGEKLIEGGIDPQKIRHMFYTIDLRRFKPFYRAGDYILYLGRLSDEKGILTFLQAAKQLPDVPFFLSGDGPQRSQLEAFVAEHELNNVTFLGMKSGAELESIVKKARVVVVPSEWHDNSPLVIYESFAYGKPVIASRMGGMPELVDHEENGFLFHAGDVKALVNYIQTLWKNPELAEEFGVAARAKAEKQFSPDWHYQNILQWYQELMQSASVMV